MLKRAVDGDTRANSKTCDCCSTWWSMTNQWIEVDLENPERIKHIVLYGAEDDDRGKHLV